MSILFLQRFVATPVLGKLALVESHGPKAHGVGTGEEGIDKSAMLDMGQAAGSSIVQAPSSFMRLNARMDRTKGTELALFSAPVEAQGQEAWGL